MKISDIELVPEGKGIFDVEIDGKLIFSKFQRGGSLIEVRFRV